MRSTRYKPTTTLQTQRNERKKSEERKETGVSHESGERVNKVTSDRLILKAFVEKEMHILHISESFDSTRST